MAAQTGGLLYCVRIETGPELGDLLEAGLPLTGIHMVTLRKRGQDEVVFEDYLDTREQAEQRMALIEDCIRRWSADGEHAWRAEIRELPGCDWAESWKAFFHVEYVSPRIVIKPSWETVPDSSGKMVIELDPGMSFGTGQHPTTRSCLKFIDAAARKKQNGAFLDIGCGSGILAIAAAKLGFAPVTAVDADPSAVARAGENARANGVADAVALHAADAATLSLPRRYDVIAANMYAEILKRTAPRIVAALSPAPESRLILAGVLVSQYAELRAAYRELGLRELQTDRESEWVSAMFGPDLPRP